MIQHVLLQGYGLGGNWIVTHGLGPGQWGTYNLYRGVGESIAAVDFATPVASGLVSGAARMAGLGHAASTKYLYVLRPVRDGMEMPNITARCVLETDPAGRWPGNRPAPVGSVSARVLAGGQIRVSWSSRTPDSAPPAAQFAVYHGSGEAIVTGTPQAIAGYEADGPYSCSFTLTDGQAYWFAVTAVGEGGLESVPSPSAGPYVARASAPNAPTLTIEATF
ncbi:MAG: hypothetical protein NT031_11205 [Planctomycetota bacterium]|nr:hypothetical protein [Planctomycetota bacterium]